MFGIFPTDVRARAQPRVLGEHSVRVPLTAQSLRNEGVRGGFSGALHTIFILQLAERWLCDLQIMMQNEGDCFCWTINVVSNQSACMLILCPAYSDVQSLLHHMLSGSEFNVNERPGQKLKNEEDIVSAIGIGSKGTHKVWGMLSYTWATCWVRACVVSGLMEVG